MDGRRASADGEWEGAVFSMTIIVMLFIMMIMTPHLVALIRTSCDSCRSDEPKVVSERCLRSHTRTTILLKQIWFSTERLFPLLWDNLQ